MAIAHSGAREKVKYIDTLMAYELQATLLVALLLIFSFSAGCTGSEESNGPTRLKPPRQQPRQRKHRHH